MFSTVMLKNCMLKSPIKVSVQRGSNTESYHEVIGLVVNSKNTVLHSWGNIDQKIYPRSSIKPIQAISIILSGAHKKFNLSPVELAIACASHNAEEKHLNVVDNWLKRMNLNEGDLSCGGHLPFNQNVLTRLLKANLDYTQLHNNCSGKHAGMLATALALNAPTKDYLNKNHPVQLYIKKIIETLAGETIPDNCIAIDGCSMPTYYMSMQSLGLCMARFADPSDLDTDWQQAIKTLYQAMVENPFYIAGTDRYCTDMISLQNKKLIVKTGAEGVMFAAIPSLQLGVVVKAQDGATRASEMAMSYILKKLGMLDNIEFEKFFNVSVKNWNNISTGKIIVNL